MAWKLTEGVRQDARGRLYRTLVNSRGKQDIRYVEHPSAETPAGYTVPVPAEPARKRSTLKLSTQEQKKRLAVLEFRTKGSVARSTFSSARELYSQMPALLPLFRSPDQGKTWVPVEDTISDYHNIWHTEVE